MQIINTMVRRIDVLDAAGHLAAVYEPSGLVLSTRPEVTTSTLVLEGRQVPLTRKGLAPVSATREGTPVALPEECDGVYYLVSALVVKALPRRDFVTPGELVRHPRTKRPIGCIGLDHA